jgi:hypothetical protein
MANQVCFEPLAVLGEVFSRFQAALKSFLTLFVAFDTLLELAVLSLQLRLLRAACAKLIPELELDLACLLDLSGVFVNPPGQH